MVTCVLLVSTATLWAETENPEEISDFLNRIGGDGAADEFVTVLDETLAGADGDEVFVITAEDGKPCVKGSTLSAITTGIGWYLNHYAYVNLTWNNLTTDLTAVSLPVPTAGEEHTCSAVYRYYLNYCTFSYSMSTWTWERWEREIDWMALHGINMPLQIVGLDVVWYNLLTEDMGYTADEANDFIAGPCFQAWWGMNNLEGWGGKNADWWYERQASLAAKIVERERELGMEPVLPGYSGMVPSDIEEHGYDATSQGTWCGFQRPYILDPNGDDFATVAANYYAHLEDVMGTSAYYSMDPFHEGANTGSIDVASAYAAIGDAMKAANGEAQWVIQFWQWSSDQYNVLSEVEVGDLIVLDLFSDAHTHFGEYKGHDAVYCMLNNFGARTGFYGRLTKVMSEYFEESASYSNIKGIGVTSEGIEQTPILYDALYELPWMDEAPDAAEWVAEYTKSRYGVENSDAQEAWEKLRLSSLNCSSTLQGPMEAVICARPALSVSAVSSWGGTDIFYDAQEVVRAAHLLLGADLSGDNYSYDLTDITRQALTDYAYYLLSAINQAYSSGDTETYENRRDRYLQLILDIDELLCTNENFMLGRWTETARAIVEEETSAAKPDSAADWLELSNARTLITTWGDENASESGGLRDYSYREWGGMLKDFYYNRWSQYFAALDGEADEPDWFDNDWAWAHNNSDYTYTTATTGETRSVAAAVLESYFVPFSLDDETYYIYRGFDTDGSDSIEFEVYRGEDYTVPADLPADLTAEIGIDFDNDGAIGDDEMASGLTISVPTGSVTGEVMAVLSLSDGTEFTYTVLLRDAITEERTVSVAVADESEGSVSISGSDELSVTSAEEVTIQAEPADGYAFDYWTDSSGNIVSYDNPYTYYGADGETFTAYFYVDKWTIPEEDYADWSTIEEYGQYLASLTLTQNGQDAVSLYSASSCPEDLYHVVGRANIPDGSQFTLAWSGPNTTGLAYCRLSAYVDLNCDGDFDDDDECVAVVGNKYSSSNTSVAVGELTILLPYGVPQGVTRARLRFDSSYLVTGLDSETGGMPADAETKRMVYDIPLNITEYAAQECTVSVQSSNTDYGTVDANGQSTTYTYQSGEEIVFRAYPVSSAYEVEWMDQYDRDVPESWVDGNSIRFKAPESGTYTARFYQQSVTVGDWEFSYDDASDGGVTLTGVLEGEGELDLTEENSLATSIVGIEADVLAGNTDLTSLTLPASLTSLGVGEALLETSVEGDGNYTTITLDEAIAASSAWTLTLTATNDGSTYNTWGSGLLATGTDPLADSYSGGFQLYLAAAGTLTVKVGSSETSFSTALGESFTIEIAYDGEGTLTITVVTADGTATTKTVSQTLDEISSFSAALPSGVDITSLVVELADGASYMDVFAGCTSLTDIEVEEGNAEFSSVDGLLYDAAGEQLLVYPEGRLTAHVFQLLTGDGSYVYAAPSADADGVMLTDEGSDTGVDVLSSVASVANSLWQLEACDEGYRVVHVNSGAYWATDGVDDVVELAQSTGETDVYVYSLSIEDNEPVLTLLSDGGYAVETDGGVSFGEESEAWVVCELAAISVEIEYENWAALCLPVGVMVPEEATVLVVQSADSENAELSFDEVEAGSVVPSGVGVLIYAEQSSAEFPICYEDAEDDISDNLLTGSTIARTGLEAGSFYVLSADDDEVGLMLSDGTSVPANSAYLLVSDIPDGASVPSLFSLTGVDGIEVVTSDDSAVYDLQGRLVRDVQVGVYIKNGRKILK